MENYSLFHIAKTEKKGEKQSVNHQSSFNNKPLGVGDTRV